MLRPHWIEGVARKRSADGKRMGTYFCLRAFCADDLVSLVHSINESEVANRVTHVPCPYTLDDARAWLERMKANEEVIKSGELPPRMDWAIAVQELREGGSLYNYVIGSIAFIRVMPHKAQLSYWLSADFRGRGIMTEAVKLVAQFGFKECGFKRIYGKTRDDNAASQSVLRKAGFIDEGVTHNDWEKDGKVWDSRTFAIWVK